MTVELLSCFFFVTIWWWQNNDIYLNIYIYIYLYYNPCFCFSTIRFFVISAAVAFLHALTKELTASILMVASTLLQPHWVQWVVVLRWKAILFCSPKYKCADVFGGRKNWVHGLIDYCTIKSWQSRQLLTFGCYYMPRRSLLYAYRYTPHKINRGTYTGFQLHIVVLLAIVK